MNLLLRFVLSACFMLGALSSFSQVTTASILGSVEDENGQKLVGATVIAVHSPSGSKYGTNTRFGGAYNLPNLRVGGPYTLTVSYTGYATQTFSDIYLSLAQKLRINVLLQEEGVQVDAVEITAGAGVLSDKRTGAATNINSDQLRNLPTISRSASDYYRLSPQSDGNSFGGRNDQFNNFSLDGSIFNNPFGLDAATPGGQTDAQPISLDAIDQIQVSLAPYDVTQAGFTGAAVNAVTKSGTNEVQGTVFGFFRNQSLTGSTVAGSDIVVPELSQLQAGFSIGGPIIKDRIFFFANFEMERRTDPGSNFVPAAPGKSGDNVSRVAESDLILVSQALQSLGYDPGLYQGFNHQTNNEKGIFKLDFNLSESHKLTATYNFLNAFKDKPAHPSALGRRGPDLTTLQFQNSGYRINNILHSGIVELKSVFGNKASNKLQVGASAFLDSREAFSSPFPVVNINKDGIRYIVAGHEPFSINNRLDQYVMQINNNFNIYAGTHTITIGTSLERFSFDNSFNLGVYDSPSNQGGTFAAGFDSVQQFVDSVNAGAFADEAAFAQETFDRNEEEGSWALAETNVGQWAVYAQDEWAVTPDIVLTYGVRMDLPLFFDTPTKAQENIDRQCCYDPSITYFDENGESITFDHTELPASVPLISPRLGFNIDLAGDQSSQLRGGTGLFSGRFPFVWVGNQVANPNWWFYTVTRPDFQFPQVWRSNLGFDQKFGGGWIASVDLIYTKDINGMMVRNYGIKPPSGSLDGVEGHVRPIYTADDRTTPFGNNAYVFTNTNIGYTFNATVQLQKSWENGLYTSLAYNYLEAEDASSIEAEISSDAYDRNPALGHVNEAVSAPSLYGNKHRIVGTAYKKFSYANDALATTISLFFEAAQGGRFSYTYFGDINGDGSFINDLIYIPTSSDVTEMAFVGDAEAQAAQRTALNAFIEQDDYLSSRRGEFAEKYSILSPWYSRVDMRILQDFNFQVGTKTNTIQLSLDFLNLANLLNNNWGVRQFPVNTQPLSVSTENGVPTYGFDTGLSNTFANDFSLLSRWQLQLGLRYIF